MHNNEIETRHVELPAPTIWPLILALGVALTFAGLLSTIYVTLTGAALLLASAVGWWLQVLPAERHEYVPLHPEGDTPIPVAAIPVDKIRAARHTEKKGYRVEHVKVWGSALKGGVVGGFFMAAVAMFFGWISQGSIWYPINLLAAAADSGLTAATVQELCRFSTTGLVLGLIIHAGTCLLVGVLYAVMLPMFPNKAFWWAGLSAPVLWSGLIGSTLTLVNPAMAARIDWLWFVGSQLAFGLTGGYVIARSEAIEKRRSLPLAVRAGLETPGLIGNDKTNPNP